MRTVPEQLERARVRRKLSVAELLRRSKLTIDRTSLTRKLKGQQRMYVDEAQVLSNVMVARLTWAPRRAA